MNTESWCRVESSSKEGWLRSQRKHYPNALKSTVFDPKKPDRFEEMHQDKVTGKSVDEIEKRKHFKEKCE